MNEGLIRVRDFAQACGCTPQNIYGHLKTYAAELEGHTHQGKGRQGVFLDEYAQDFLRSVMYPKELGNNALMDEINQLRAALVQASQENARLATRLAATESERDRAMLDAGQYQKALTASQETEERQQARIQELAKERQDMEVRAMSAELRERQAEADKDHMRDEIYRLRENVYGLTDDLAWAQTPWWKKIGKKQPIRDYSAYARNEGPAVLVDPEE